MGKGLHVEIFGAIFASTQFSVTPTRRMSRLPMDGGNPTIWARERVRTLGRLCHPAEGGCWYLENLSPTAAEYVRRVPGPTLSTTVTGILKCSISLSTAIA